LLHPEQARLPDCATSRYMRSTTRAPDCNVCSALDLEGTDSVVFATSTRGAGHQPWAGYGRLDSTCWSPAVTRFSTRLFRFRASTFMTTTPNGVSLMYPHSRHRASEHARIHRVSVNTASI